MRIFCIIDSLGSGGAQRQMVNLACGLKQKGHDVQLVIYNPNSQFFRPIIDSNSIRVHEIDRKRTTKLFIPIIISRLIRDNNIQIIISFLSGANIYSILGRKFSLQEPLLIVGERNAGLAEHSRLASFFRRLLYIATDYVVTNSYSRAVELKKSFWLKEKVRTIYNGYDFNAVNKIWAARPIRDLRFIVIGRVTPQKNGLTLSRALVLFYRRNGFALNVTWIGRQEKDKKSLELRNEIEGVLCSCAAVSERWVWQGERNDVYEIMSKSDALIHVSLFEGLPNAICEAMIIGLPVIASSVCDHPLLIKDGERGLLCNPLSVKSICRALEKYVALTPAERVEMGVCARKYARLTLGTKRMIRDYESLFRAG